MSKLTFHYLKLFFDAAKNNSPFLIFFCVKKKCLEKSVLFFVVVCPVCRENPQKKEKHQISGVLININIDREFFFQTNFK